MDRQTLEQKLHAVFRNLTPEVYYFFEGNEHFVQIISESFKNKSMAVRMVEVMSCVRRSPEMLNLDLQFDFTFVPMTPNEHKNINDNNFEPETGNDSGSGFGNVAKSP